MGTPFSLTLPMATGGATPYAYTATNLPAGLAFDATSRVLSGTPTAAQTRAVDYQVTDDDGDSESDQFNIVVSAAVPALALPATADQTARVGVLFSITLPEATGGVTPYAYTATNRPAGLVFNASTRVLSGTPTTIQTRAVRYRVTDNDGTQVDDFFDVDVLAAPTSAGDVVLAAGSLTVSADRALGRVSVELGSDTLVGAVPVDEWAHVAVRLSAAALELWVNGVRLGTAPAPAGTVLDGEAVEMAVAGGTAVDMALDEWGVWDTAIDVADLAARARHRRYFGGYIYGIADETITGPIDEHVVSANLGGYGLRLDGSFVRRTFATASGASLRSIVSDVIDDAGLTGVFDPHGVSLDDTVPRAVYPVRSVMAILRELANDHGAIVTVDEWRSINIVRRADVEHVDLVLRGAPGANVRSIKRVTEPRFFANRVVVIGRDTPGSYEDKFAIDGVSRVWDLTHQPEEVKAIRIDGVDQAFGDDGDPYIADLGQARIELDAAAPTPAAGQMEVLYSVTSDLVVTQDNQAAIDAIGFPIAKRYEDDAIDTPSVARVKAAAYLDRHDQPFEYYQTETLAGEVEHVAPGTAPRFLFPRHSLNNVRLLIESVVTKLGKVGSSFHGVTHVIKATAKDYQGDYADYWRERFDTQPPAPRPIVSTVTDPNQVIVRPGNVAIPARLPLSLGSCLGLVTDVDWVIPDGANLVRVSGHELAHPLAMTFMTRCWPRTTLAPGMSFELQLYDHSAGVPIGSAVGIANSARGGERGTLRSITLPLKEFDITFRVRSIGGLRGGRSWSVVVDLDTGL